MPIALADHHFERLEDRTTLLSAMEGAGKLIEDDEMKAAMAGRGLGTPATRAATIEGLINEKYLLREGREMRPTAKAFQLMTLLRGLGVEELTQPEMTGGWEHQLALMERGETTRQAFMQDLNLTDFSKDETLRKIFHGMGQIVFFTVGEDECRAWAVPRGVRAQEGQALAFEPVRVLPLSWWWNTSFLVRNAPLPLADGGMVLPAYFEIGVKYPVALRFDAAGNFQLIVTNPANGDVLGTAPDAGMAELDAAISAARAAFPGWRATPYAERQAVVAKIGEVITANAEELMRSLTLEQGKPTAQAQFEVFGAAAWAQARAYARKSKPR